MHKYDIAIIGLGPAGLSLIHFLMEESFNKGIVAFEAKKHAGLNNHCAGLVSSTFIRLMWPFTRDIIINSFKGFYVTTLSSNKSLHVKLNNKAYVINRVEYERKIFEKIKDSITYRLREPVIDIWKNKIILRKNRSVEAKTIIISEGSTHKLRTKILGRGGKDRVYGIQEDVKAKPEYINDFTVIFSDKYAKEFFGWLIPLSTNKARIGIAGNKVSLKMLRLFEKHIVKKKLITEIVDRSRPFGGSILIKPPNKIDHVNSLIFLGDSGYHVKPLTGGGLFILTLFSKALAKALASVHNHEEALNLYYKETSMIRKRLHVQNIISRIIHKLSERDKAMIIEALYQNEIFLKDYDFHEVSLLSLLANSNILLKILASSPSIIKEFLKSRAQ